MEFISLQSRVVRGYVGNAVAIPTLQATGLNAWPVDTVLYPHHPGHGPASRKVTDAAELAALLSVVLSRIEGPAVLLSGYLAVPDQGLAALAVLDNARDDGRDVALYLDPVFGDDTEGIYVDPSLVAYFRECAVPAATVVMPNRFELATLSGHAIETPKDAVEASRQLISRGPGLVLVSSVPMGTDALANILVSPNDAWICSVPKRPLRAKGTGDMLSAAFSGLLAGGMPPVAALSSAVALVQSAVEDCCRRNLSEMDVPHVLGTTISLLSPVPAQPLVV
ncbi:MAG: pyridoxal kinase [Rhodospirillales bacterium]